MLNLHYCGDVSDRKLIVAGDEVRIADYPLTGTYSHYLIWYRNVVSISSTDPESGALRHVCTGTLIYNDVVLTAAHCIHDVSVESTVVLVGCDNYLLATSDQIFKVASFSHPGFIYRGFTAQNDIALLFLSRCAKAVVPFPLLATQTSEQDATCTSVESVGFGKSERIPAHLFVPDGKMRALSHSQSVHSNFVCKAAFVRHTVQTEYKSKQVSKAAMDLLSHSITDNMGCYGGEETAVVHGYPCEGDSGGPVLNRATRALIGISSFSSESCGTLPNYFTRVGMYSSWIKAEISKRKRLVCAGDRAVDNIFVTGTPSSRILSEPRNEPTPESDQALSNMTTAIQVSCTSEFTAINSALREPTVPLQDIRDGCVAYLRCIETATGTRTVDTANFLLDRFPSNLNEAMDAPLETKTMISRFLLCTSTYELFYKSLADESGVTPSYMATTPANAECKAVAV